MRIRGKIKLHGTNGAVRVNYATGEVSAQSRNRMLSVHEDNMGFANWVESQREAWLSNIQGLSASEVTFYGEWAGPGIQERDAVTKIERKTFFVFALLIDEYMYSSPTTIKNFLSVGLDDVFVLPWQTKEYRISPSSKTSVESFAEEVSDLAETVGDCDPFIKETFGIFGPGEGLVFTPGLSVSCDLYSMLTFKVKCEAHRVKKSKKAATVKFMVPEDVQDFLDTFVTEQRLRQGLTEVCGGEFDKRKTSDFLKWFGSDVKKESQIELEEMGFEWKQVSKHVNSKAVSWYIENCEKVAA